MVKSKQIPQFKNEDEERDFWSDHSPLDYPDQFRPVKLNLSNLKPSTKTITMRVPEYLLDNIKQIANRKDVPYQSLIKVYLHQIVKQEMSAHGDR